MNNIAIFGMGYVGCVTLAALSSMGHKVVGIEVDEEKIIMLRRGIPTVNEPGLKYLINEGISNQFISFTSDCNNGIVDSSIAIICVGTPSKENGHVNLEYVNRCLDQIIHYVELNKLEKDYTIAVRSTVPPNFLDIYLKNKNQSLPENIKIIANPEFLREGTALSDFMDPPFNLIGLSNTNQKINDYINLFEDIKTENITTSFSTAFLVKYASNVFHGLKATFANEIGLFSENIGSDANEVLDIFSKDNHLNISSKYLKNGYAIGGSCLPKDLKAFINMANSEMISIPLIESIEKSNVNLIKYTVEKLIKTNKQNFGFYGVTFKQNTDDLRESPFAKTIIALAKEGKMIFIYDDDIIPENLNGLNKMIYEKLSKNESINFINDPITLFEKSDVIVNTKEDIDKIKSGLNNYKNPVLDLSVGRQIKKSHPEIINL